MVSNMVKDHTRKLSYTKIRQTQCYQLLCWNFHLLFASIESYILGLQLIIAFVVDSAAD